MRTSVSPMRRNEFGQPIGDEVPGWAGRPAIAPVTLEGRTCRVEPLDESNLDALYAGLCEQSPPETWTYIMGGPYDDRDGFEGHVAGLHGIPACVPLAIVAPDGSGPGTGPDLGLGIACYLRIDPANGSVEVGGIVMATALQRTTAATEAM